MIRLPLLAFTRDVDNPCEAWSPCERHETGNGDCDTDGHYMCKECRHLSRRALVERQLYCDLTDGLGHSCDERCALDGDAYAAFLRSRDEEQRVSLAQFRAKRRSARRAEVA